VSAELPSYEELAALMVELRAEVAALRAENAQLRVENAELRAQLGQNSRNSSKPPSSDGLIKPAPKSLRGRSGRRPGGQAGHRGQTLCQVADPDRRRRYVPRRCRGCGKGLAGAVEVGLERRQVFAIPPIRVRVTEHQLIKRRCGCGPADDQASRSAPTASANASTRSASTLDRPRSTALFQLATELPAAILARMLGIHIKVAVAWQQAASGDWR
jgi:transposase